ncbi:MULTISPECIES: cysteine desulfurase family protein [unclassified Sphingobacterium]|uniref:cysteine desulfurase family protein n=1 Tax=unclassified Sphingobacterium TaxID=2609468 RepID=UPI0025F46F1D|nr:MULTISPECIES: cysteine desulfurase family protein [unclassified Sphingobacterium]
MDLQYIYLDYNATTPLDSRVQDVMIPYFKDFYANPNSSHLFGLSVQETIEEATENLATVLGGGPNNILYTSGATEAVNLAIKGLIPSERKHIVTLATEHNAVLATCSFLENFGYQVTYLPVDPAGMTDLELLTDVITEQTLLVCVMLANNETGVIQPIKQISKIAHENGALMLCDATQAIGKLPVDVLELEVDFLLFSAHKFYGPKGIGGLYVSNGTRKRLTPQIHGGGQQRGLRSGTLNVPGIIGMGKAAEIAVAEMSSDCDRIGQLRNRLEEALLTIPGTRVNGHAQHRLCNTSNICFRGVPAEQLIMALGTISVASGSACSATVTKPSHVLKAMGLSDEDGMSSIRFSLGRFTTEEEISRTIEAVRLSVSKLRMSN